MEVKFNAATTQRPQEVRTMDAPLITIDLCSFTEQIRKEKKWKETDRNAITVFKTNGLQIVLIALRKGAEMVKHATAGIISIQVLKGKMQLKTDKQTVKLGVGQLLALHEGIEYNLLAKKEDFFPVNTDNYIGG